MLRCPPGGTVSQCSWMHIWSCLASSYRAREHGAGRPRSGALVQVPRAGAIGER